MYLLIENKCFVKCFYNLMCVSDYIKYQFLYRPLTCRFCKSLADVRKCIPHMVLHVLKHTFLWCIRCLLSFSLNSRYCLCVCTFMCTSRSHVNACVTITSANPVSVCIQMYTVTVFVEVLLPVLYFLTWNLHILRYFFGYCFSYALRRYLIRH